VVAEDTRFWREKICRLLDPGGHEVEAVDNGDDAIRLCLNPTRPVDLLILDLVMPGTDGFEVARVLRGRRLTADLPIVAVTSVFKKDDFPSGTKAQGFDAVLEKAASPDQLMFTFNKFLTPACPRPRPGSPFLPAVPAGDASAGHHEPLAIRGLRQHREPGGGRDLLVLRAAGRTAGEARVLA
jgi:CheY-like chemotaxis protein